MEHDIQKQIQELRNELAELRYILSLKTGLGSADIRGKLRSGSSIVINAGDIDSAGMFGAGVVDQTAIGANAVGQSELKEEYIAITVLAGQTSGTGTATSGSIIIGWRPTGNQDQFIDNIAISGTTVTITLAAAAVADNLFEVILLKS